jgi:hypothetical protein
VSVEATAGDITQGVPFVLFVFLLVFTSFAIFVAFGLDFHFGGSRWLGRRKGDQRSSEYEVWMVRTFSVPPKKSLAVGRQ